MANITLITRAGPPSFNPSTIPAIAPIADDALGWIQRTLPCLVAITAGQAVLIDPTTGKWDVAAADTAPHARVYGIALRNAPAGGGLTVCRHGTLDGFDLSGLAYGASVYLSDTPGDLADGAGTVTVLVGRVVPGTSTSVGVAYDKLLEVLL